MQPRLLHGGVLHVLHGHGMFKTPSTNYWVLTINSILNIQSYFAKVIYNLFTFTIYIVAKHGGGGDEHSTFSNNNSG